MRARWELCRSDDGQFYVRFRSSNGNIIVTSETYKRKRSAVRATELVASSLFPGVEVRDLTEKP